MKNYVQKWICMLCSLAMLFGLTTVMPVAADTAAAPTEEKSLYEQILERDGFLEGIWFPWFTHDYLGCSLTANDMGHKMIDNNWYSMDTVGLDAYGADKVYKEIYNLKALGYNMMAYPGSIYFEGVVMDDNGDVLGVKEDYLVNMRRLLDMCREIGMPVMWNILMHSSSIHDYYGFDAWAIMSQLYCNPEVTDHYIERFVRPVCQVLAEYTDIVAMIALVDEIENEMNDSQIGNKTTGNGHAISYGMSKENMVYLVSSINDVVKEELPGVARTLAANFNDLATYSELDLDVIGRNRYDNLGGCDSMDHYYATAPMILTEFNLDVDPPPSEERFLQVHINFRENMKACGYHGGFTWCWQPTINGSGGCADLLAKGAQSLTDFREYMYKLRWYVTDNRNAYRGKEDAMDVPTFFYVNNTQEIEWLPSRQATSMDLLRSNDGGKTWKTIVNNEKQDTFMVGYKCLYSDDYGTRNSIYKIIARDNRGNEVESAVSNAPSDATKYVQTAKKTDIEILKRPDVPAAGPIPENASFLKLFHYGVVNDRPQNDEVNMIQNGSFENTTGGQWNNSIFLRNGMQVVEDSTAPEGTHTLFFNSSDNPEYTWYTFTVDVQPNTNYVFSTWIKGDFISDDNRFAASIGVLNPATQKFMICQELSTRSSRDYQQIHPRSWDARWHLRAVGFNSGNETQITIGLLGRSSRLWVDGVAMYENDQGIHYFGENMQGVVTINLTDDNYCEPEDSLIENVRMDDPDSNFWQSGGGWKNGFLSLEDTQSGYGPALKYTGGENSKGIYYIKWIDVEPDTDYVFSVDVKVLKDGNGRLELLDDKMSGPVAVLGLDFDQSSFGSDWFNFHMLINTDAFTRIGIAFCDKGGEALIDNMRLFKPEYATEGQDVSLDGWVKSDFGWLYYESGNKVTDKWVSYNGGWYYVDDNGYMVSNTWKKDSVGWCYLGDNGKMATNKWVKDSVGWCYVGSDGYCVTNKWVADSKGWCYLDDQGRMVTNKWVKDSVGWCYVGADGYCVTNKWVADSKGWCYLDGSGRMVTNKWVKDSVGWCYVGGDGYCVTNKWVADSKGWCYLDANGRMVYDTWVDGYYVNANGYWV